MTSEPVARLNLCPDCTHCPEVLVYPDRVVIGEAPQVAVLTREQWSVLVQAVRRGDLEPTPEPTKACPGGCDSPGCGCAQRA